MTNPVTPLVGNDFYLKIGNGASPEVFSYLCLFTSIDDDNGSDTEDAMVGDCDDPAALAESITIVKALTKGVSGSGLCDRSKSCYARLWDIYRSGRAGNFQKILLGSGGETEQFAAVVTSLKESKADQGFVKASFTLKAYGKPTVTPNA